jgi:hypothetical protein
MTERQDLFDARLADWLEDDPDRAPDEVLRTIGAALPSVPQRRALSLWRGSRPAWAVRYGYVAAAVAVIALLTSVGLAIIGGSHPGPTPSPAPTGRPATTLAVFESPLYGYGIDYPIGWEYQTASEQLLPLGLPELYGTTVDSFTSPAAGALPNAKLIGAAASLAEGTSLAQWTTDVEGPQCGPPADQKSITVAGEPALLTTFTECHGYFHLWATVVRQGVGFHIVWLNFNGTEGQDRQLFDRILATFTFPLGITGWTSFTSTRHGISLSFPAGWSLQPATEPWIWQPNDPGPATAAQDRAIGPGNEGFIAVSQRLPDGFTPDDWWADYLGQDTSGLPAGCFPATRAGYESVTVEGLPAYLHGGAAMCSFTEAIVVTGGRAYELAAHPNVDIPAGQVIDRAVVDQWLATVRFDPASADDTPAAPTTTP